MPTEIVSRAEYAEETTVDGRDAGSTRQDETVTAPTGAFTALLVCATVAGLIFGAGYYTHRWMNRSGTAAPNVKYAQPDESPSKLSAEVRALAASLERLERKPVPTVDLKPVETKLDALTTAVGALPEGIHRLEGVMTRAEGGLTSIDDGVKQSRADFASLKSEVQRAITGLTRMLEGRATGSREMSAVDLGAKLFAANKYKESAQVFRQLLADKPRDARVYYLAALAQGAATNDWAGDCLRDVAEAVELERAGKPDRWEIDAALVGVPARFKPWLDSYRQRSR